MNRIGTIVIGIAAALLAGIWIGAQWEQGQQAQREAAVRAAEDKRRAEINAAEAARLAAERARAAFDRQLEDDAHAQPVINPVALPVERVRRLNQR